MTDTLTPDRTGSSSYLRERCDRCGAAARIHVILRSGGDLFFCGHHGRQHEDRLRPLAASYVDRGATVEGAATRG